MTWDEYNKLFHKEQLNLVAFKRLMDCDQEVLRLVNAAVKAEREACSAIARQWDVDHPTSNYGGCIANLIEARGQE